MFVVKTVFAFLFVVDGALLTFKAKDKVDRIYGMLYCMFAYLISMSMSQKMTGLEIAEYIVGMAILIHLIKMRFDWMTKQERKNGIYRL